MNAALQCLIRVKPLTDYLLSPASAEHVNRHNPRGMRGQVYRAYCRLLLAINSASGAVSPAGVKQAVARCNDVFQDFGQHDSAEFLVSLLDGLHEDLNQSPAAYGRLSHAELQDASGMDLHRMCNDSEIVRLFHGETRTTFQYSSGHIDEMHEALAQWTLPLPKGRSLTLEMCIEAWKKPQEVIGDEMFDGETWIQPIDCVRTIEVMRFAPVLFVQLKRFEQNGTRLVKNHAKVSYPIEFDSAQFAKEASGVYDLTGISRHAGSLSMGHYTALVRHPDDMEHWYNISDSSVRESEEESGSRITDASAMFLIYQRRP
jgi:ubiquitin C-terminal hydrolase